MCICMKTDVIHVCLGKGAPNGFSGCCVMCFIIFILLTVKCFSYVDSNFTHFVNGDIFYIFYLHYIFANIVLLYGFFLHVLKPWLGVNKGMLHVQYICSNKSTFMRQLNFIEITRLS